MDPALETVLEAPSRTPRTGTGRPSVLVTLLLMAAALTARADAPQAELSPAAIQRIDAAAAAVLAKTGTPSASIAIVRDGRIVYSQAYGRARLESNPIAARPAMRYAIGSITKQFTAAALLLLQQDGKLSLDDKVAKYVPGLMRAGDITIRQLLTHTSGYQDYWPQDYTFKAMLEPTTPTGIVERWARQPLDYEPGTRWQYSNTGYVIAGLIVEKVSGQPFHSFLEQRILAPLGLASTSDFDREPHAHGTVAGYDTYALGPPRLAMASGPGWLFGAGGLAMTAEDLARWDISLLRRSLLDEASYRALEADTLLANGVATGYGLGVDIEMEKQRRKLSHGGEVSGFTALNTVYPDDGTAIVVLTNLMASKAPETLTEKIAEIVFEHGEDAKDAARTAQARAIFEGLQQGRIDRTLFSPNANEYFSEQALADFQSSLAPLGAPQEFKHLRTWLRGGMTGRSYQAVYPGQKLRVWTYELPDGKLEQLQVQVTE
jgi:CubicO group peptidase (beta-lactamase class C family)